MVITVTPNPAIDRTLEVPSFHAGKVLRARLVRIQFAGKGVNVSRCLSCLGVKSVVTGLVGRESETLYRHSLPPDMTEDALVPIDGLTRVNVTIRDAATGTETHLREHGPAVSDAEWYRLLRAVRSCCADGHVVALCGSLPGAMPPERALDILRTAAARGARIAADCSGHVLRCLLDEPLWLIKPNRYELAELTSQPVGTITQVLTAARALTKRVHNVLVSLGAEGILLSTSQGSWLAQSPVAYVRNTVGPGDAALAGFLAATERGEQSEQSLRWAVACGAASVQADGAGSLDLDTVHKQYNLATVQQLNRGECTS